MRPPRLPPELNVAGSRYWGLYKLCVDTDGEVYNVKMIESAHRLVDSAWMALLLEFKHRPYTLNGAPVPYCYPLRLEVRSQP